MTRPQVELTEELFRYVAEHSIPDDEVAASLARGTREAFPDWAGMQIGPEQGRFLYLLVKLTGARRLCEIGTFTGMSSLWMARALLEGGTLMCLDKSEEWTALARRAWERAGVSDRIELVIGPALETLRALPSELVFDLVFIDADKGGYPDYLAETVPRLEPGGLLVADNVLWHGAVVDESDRSEDTESIRRFNRLVRDHDQLEAIILPLSDGMTLARKQA